MNTTLTPIFDQNNICTHIASVVSDSTTPVHWQNRLEEREEKFRSIAENSNDLMAIIHADGIIQYVSPSHEKILGYKLNAFEGKHHKQFIHPDDYERFKKNLTQAIALGKALHTNIKLLTKNKKAILCRVVGTAVYHNDGSFKYLTLVAQDISKNEEKKKKMEHMAYHDFLTNIPNRRKLSLEFDSALEKWQKEGRNFAYFLFDLDEFKKINDLWGHDLGDTILAEIAKCLSKKINKKDTVARVGGDEFALLVRDIDSINDIYSTAEIIKDVLNKERKIIPPNLQVSVSIGVSWSGSYKKDTINSLQKNADIALYKAKKIKGNSIIIH